MKSEAHVRAPRVHFLVFWMCIVVSALGCAPPDDSDDSGDSDDGEEAVVATSEEALTASASVFRWDPGASVSPDYDRMKSSLLSRCQSFIDQLEATPVLTRFVDEGKPSDDPAKGRSRAVWKALEEAAPAVGYCARIPNPLRATAKSALVRYGNRWIDTYRGGGSEAGDDDDPGNPINERHVLPLVLAWDQVYPTISDAQRSRIIGFLDALDGRVARFMSALRSTDSRRKNNWMMDALVIRSYAALVARRGARAASYQTTLDGFIRQSYSAPSGWSLSSCGNLRAIGAYGSFDLQERDAFTYHLKGLGTAMQLAALRPSYVGTAARDRMAVAFRLTRDYVTRAKTHREFLCTTVAFDQNNPLRGTNWDPLSAKVDYRYGRLVFPTSRAWLGAFDGDDYVAWLKVFVTANGDRVIQ